VWQPVQLRLQQTASDISVALEQPDTSTAIDGEKTVTALFATLRARPS